MKRLIVIGLVIAAGCSSGVSAPPPGEALTDCTKDFCLEIPAGWVVVNGGDYISATHEADPENTFLTAALIDREAIIDAAGGNWPATTAEVSRAFWKLLEEAEVGTFERSVRMVGGAERSWGTHEDGQMWHFLLPVGATSGIAVEIRAPNGTWETHADAVFESIRTP